MYELSSSPRMTKYLSLEESSAFLGFTPSDLYNVVLNTLPAVTDIDFNLFEMSPSSIIQKFRPIQETPSNN